MCLCFSEAKLLGFKVLSAAQVRVCAVSQDDTFAVSVIRTLPAEIHRSESHVHSFSITYTQTLTHLFLFHLCAGKGQGVNRLFQDLHILSLIWTHPWCLKIAHLNKNKVFIG